MSFGRIRKISRVRFQMGGAQVFWFVRFGGLKRPFACLGNYRFPAGWHSCQLVKKCYWTKVLAVIMISYISKKLHTSIVFLFIRTIRRLNLGLAVITINWVINKKHAAMKVISVFILESSGTSTDRRNLKERKRKTIERFRKQKRKGDL